MSSLATASVGSGGGIGSFLLAVLRQHTNEQATLFDVPAVAALARQRLAGCPVATRLRIIEGDFFTDPLPEDHDVMLIANVFHNFCPDAIASCLSVPAPVRLLGPPVAGHFWTTRPISGPSWQPSWLVRFCS